MKHSAVVSARAFLPGRVCAVSFSDGKPAPARRRLYTQAHPEPRLTYYSATLTSCRRRGIVAWACALTLVAIPRAATAQAESPTTARVRVFIECVDASCDQEFFRTEITFVDHVRQRQDADVHVLITGESTGQGGRAVTLSFFGQGAFVGRDHVLRDSFMVAESADTIRREMVRIISLGLVQYVLQSPVVETLTVTNPASSTAVATAQAAVDDPWNRWSMRVNLQGNAGGEASNRYSSINANVSANRTTEALKLNVNSFFGYRQNTFELPDGRTFLSPNREYGINGLAASALNGRWSAGTRMQYYSSTFSNQSASWYAAPAIEFNIFPYSESTRRLLTLQYSAGARGFRYEQETIYGKLEETRAAHMIVAAVSARQRWGTVSGEFETVTFLPDMSQNHVSGFGNINLNLVKGLSLNLNGSLSWIRDQIYLPREEATTEEVLVQQRQLATNYRYNMFFGISYTFGSIFSQVVNARFNSGGF